MAVGENQASPLAKRAMDSKIPLAADHVGMGNEEGVPPVSGREKRAKGPSISISIGYDFIS